MPLMALCGYGGYCVRIPGHLGAHTPNPLPATQAFDEQHILDRLNFPTPAWAGVLDPDEDD
jgi:hypothetical protein